jgi:DNA polymerase I-like protein with 3'-5' exonuclease and polymerase domains
VPNLLGHLRKRPIVIHNALFDLGWLRAKYGYVHEGEVRCTLTAARVLHNGDDFSYKNDLTSIRVRYLDRTVEEMATDQAKSNWSGDLSGEQIRYAADDVADLHRLWKILSERCRDHDLEDTLDLELSLIPVLIDLQAVGMPFHVGIAMTQENVLRDELAAIDEAIRERLPEPEQPVPKPRARKPPEHLELNCRSTYMLQALALR